MADDSGMIASEDGESLVLPPLRCPHGKDKSHGGLGKGCCDAGIEGAKYLRDKQARLTAPARTPSATADNGEPHHDG